MSKPELWEVVVGFFRRNTFEVVPPNEEWKLDVFRRMNPGLFPPEGKQSGPEDGLAVETSEPSQGRRHPEG